MARSATREHLPRIVLWLLIFAYIGFFSAASIRLHDAYLTHTADLGQIDLAIWNTAHGRFVQEIKGEQISTRLTDHVEPIFAVVSLVFWIWDDVRALLILQSAVLGMTAWPLYKIARLRLRAAIDERVAAWGALAFALVYLLAPSLEAANMAEFHAAPLAVLPIAIALWGIERGSRAQYLVACIALAAVKEEMALMSIMLGLWGAWRGYRLGGERRSWLVSGAAVAVASGLWFAIATFVIIPAHARPVYGATESVYFQRYGELGDSAADILRSLVTRPGLVWRIVTAPERQAYLGGLLATVGGLSLIGLEAWILSLPLMAANILSAYPAQYSGELHYTAPLIPYAVFGAILGSERVILVIRRRRADATQWAVLGITIWLLAWSLAYHVNRGWTPLGARFQWPEVTAHHRLAERFYRQIPKEAPISVTTALYPHLSHRQRIYTFPDLGDAVYVLLEVNGTTDMNPGDLRSAYEALLASQRFCILDAADGFILLGPPGEGCLSTLPDEFYSFLRVEAPQPTFAFKSRFGEQLRFHGFDIIYDQDQDLTRVRMYWAAEAPIPPGWQIWPFFVGPDGEVVEDIVARPPVGLLWYPPERWRPGEVIAIDTVPWRLPDRWALALGVATKMPWWEHVNRVRATKGGGGRVIEGTWIVYDPVQRGEQGYRPITEADWPTQLDAGPLRFGSAIVLRGSSLPSQVRAGETLWFDLVWEARQRVEEDYTIFVHLRDSAGQTVAQQDARPSWFGPWPTQTWDAGRYPDAHRLEISPRTPPGTYEVVIGMYRLTDGERLLIYGPGGELLGTEAKLSAIDVLPLSQAQE